MRSSRKILMRAGTPPRGELGALSHLGSFVCNYLHSPSNARCNTNFLSQPFGNKVPQPQPPHDTSHPHSLTRSQYKRSLRSPARQHRQSTRIQRRAQARKTYRTWNSTFPSNSLLVVRAPQVGSQPKAFIWSHSTSSLTRRQTAFEFNRNIF